MPTLSDTAIASLLTPYLPDPPATLIPKLSLYLDLLLKWNARTNPTAIRDPEEIVRRHFGESLFTAAHLPAAHTLLDFGSGAGFPGLPIALFHPQLRVPLAESQNKKAAFLREAVRTLQLSTQVWPNRVESMSPDQRFDIVAMRAVDNIQVALPAAIARITLPGHLALLTTTSQAPQGGRSIPLPNSESGLLYLQAFHVEHSPQPGLGRH